jgi:hypothetical protein
MAMARKIKQQKFPQAAFEISIADAVAQLLRPRDVTPGDTFHFQTNGDVLIITRIGTTIEEVPD